MTDPLAFLSGGGEAARMIRARDWSAHPLGAPQTWPAELRTALSLVLNSPESMILAWGPDLHFFFNETYFPLLGPRLSWAMGERFDRVWADGWEQAKPIVEDALAGRAKRFIDVPWALDTDRGPAATWWSFSYSRVLDAQGDIAGLFILTNETTARVMADAALRESEERLRLVIEGAKDHVILTTDLTGAITSWSAGAQTTLGWSADETVGQPFAMIFTPDDRANGVAARELVTAEQNGFASDARWHFDKDGGRVFLNGSVRPLPRDARGRERGFIKIARDETQRWHAERQLAGEAERQRASLQQMPGFAAVLSGPDHRYLYVNDAYVKIGGPRDYIGKTVRDVFSELEGQGFYELLDRVYSTGEPFSVTAMPIRLAGEGEDRFIDFSYQPVRDDGGAVSGIFVGGYDVTEARRNVVALAESEARYRTLFNSLDEGFCIIEFRDGPHGPANDYIHLEANAAFKGLAGLDVVGRSVRDVDPDEADDWIERYRSVLQTGKAIRFQRELAATGRHLDVAAFRIEPAERRQIALLFQDVTAEVLTRERYRLAIEATEVGIFDYDLVTGALGWDARVRYLFGVAPAAAVTYEDSFLPGVHPDDRAAADAAVQASLDPRGSGVFDIEYRVRAFDTGTERWLAAKGQAVFVAGRTIRFVGTVRDVTATKTAETALRAAEERYRLATRATNDAIWDWDLATNHVIWNEALMAAYGHRLDEVGPIGEWWIAHIHSDDRQRIKTSLHAVIDGGGTAWTSEYRFRRADGSYADVLDRGFVTRDGDGKAIRMVGAMLDLSERKRAEAALQLLNETLEEQVETRTRERNRLWETTNDLMGTAGLDGYLKAVNPAWMQMLGWSETELLSQPFAALIDPADHAATADVVRRLGAGQTVTGFVDRVLMKNGEARVVMWTAVPDKGTGLFHIVGRDLTEQRQVEEALRQSQKMEAVGQLTGGLAHDFNNLLAGISGSLELMNARLSQGRVKEVDKYMTAAQGAARRAAALTHRLLAFSRRQTLAPKPTDVNLLVAGMEELIRRTVGPSTQMEVVGAAGLWIALVDPPQLENALLNLCINARDAMPDGGRITIETANKWLDRAAARKYDMPEGQYLSLCVTDSGTGMAPAIMEKAFDPFFTTKPIGEGTGLGLSMIYGFAQQSGGQVRLYSEVGQGTTVCIYLPRYQGKVEAIDLTDDRDATPRAQQGETVLIVDDEPTVRMLVTDVLDELGYTAIEAADSLAGLKVLQSDVRIDLLITDVGLPGGMNGRQMADAARVGRPGLKVLFITGYAENALFNNGHLEPGMSVLTKPFPVDTLGARIREMIARHGSVA